MKITVKLFGAFRQFSNKDEIELELPLHSNLAQLRIALNAACGEGCDSKLMEHAVFANDEQVLDDNTELDLTLGSLAVLPPVSGG